MEEQYFKNLVCAQHVMNTKAESPVLDQLVKAIPIMIMLIAFFYYVVPHIPDALASPEAKDASALASTLDSLEQKGQRELPQAFFATACINAPCEPPEITLYPQGNAEPRCLAHACLCIKTKQEQRCEPLAARACITTLTGCSRTPCVVKEQHAILTPGKTLNVCRHCNGQLTLDTTTQSCT